MPVKNASLWLDECIQSIIHQSFSDWELLTLDDRSTDDSAIKLAEWSTKDPRIKVFKPNGEGILPALQLLYDHASGEWVSRMDADDVMPVSKLEILVGALGGSESRVATGKVQYFSEAPISQGYKKYEKWLNDRARICDHYQWIYRECVVAGANWLCHRSCVDFKTLSYPEDYDLTFQWYQNEVEIVASEHVTHLWREHPGRTSRNSENYQQPAFFKLKLQRFIQLDYDPNRSLLILGNQRKSALTQDEFIQFNIPFTVIDKDALSILHDAKNPQVLVTVYPDLEKREEIRDLLSSISLLEGKDWWWL